MAVKIKIVTTADKWLDAYVEREYRIPSLLTFVTLPVNPSEHLVAFAYLIGKVEAMLDGKEFEVVE